MMIITGSKNRLYELDGFDDGGMPSPVFDLLLTIAEIIFFSAITFRAHSYDKFHKNEIFFIYSN